MGVALVGAAIVGVALVGVALVGMALGVALVALKTPTPPLSP